MRILSDDAAPSIKKGALICTLDIQYQKGIAYVAADISSYGYGQLGRYGLILPVEQEYVPGFFAFREGPLLIRILQQLEEIEGLQPNLLIIDGHGIAHPRKMGVASWVGVKLGIPSLGLGKETLIKYTGELEEQAGSTLPIYWQDELRGHVLRSQTGIKPIFVSPGHQISHQACIEITLSLAGKYRIIDPMRRADMSARKMAREAGENDKMDFLYQLS